MGSQMALLLEVLVSAFSSWATFSSGFFSLLATSSSLVTTSACLVFLSRCGSKCSEDRDTVAPTTKYKLALMELSGMSGHSGEYGNKRHLGT